MPVSDFVNVVTRQPVIIVTCDPPTRRLEGRLKDGAVIQIAGWSASPFFRWPNEGETWNVVYENGLPTLDGYVEPADSLVPSSSLSPGEARIDASTAKFTNNIDVGSSLSVHGVAAFDISPTAPTPLATSNDTTLATTAWVNANTSTDADLAAHAVDTTAIHGIADTSRLVTIDNIATVGSNFVTLDGTQTITGLKTFSSALALTSTLSVTGNASMSNLAVSTSIGVTNSGGGVSLIPGSASQAGYIQWNQGTTGNRLGYLGWINTDVVLTLENSASFKVVGGNTATTGSISLTGGGTDWSIAPKASAPNAAEIRFGDGTGWVTGFGPKTGADAAIQTLRIFDWGGFGFPDAAGINDIYVYRSGAVLETTGGLLVAGAITGMTNVTGTGSFVLAASPTLTGTPTSPTAAVDTNTTQVATTAYVVAQGYLKSSTAGTTYQPLDTDLTNIAALTAAGLLVRTSGTTWAHRTITGTAGQITVTNGDGVAGNPTITLPATITQATTFSSLLTSQAGVAVGGALTGATTGAFSGNVTVGGTLTGMTNVTGTGNLVLATSPTLVTPTLGVASASSLALSGALTGATTGAFSSNVTVGGTLGVTGISTLATTNVTGTLGLVGATTTPVFFVGTSGATNPQTAIHTDGKIEFGDGTAVRDTNLYRLSADVLASDSRIMSIRTTTAGTAFATRISADPDTRWSVKTDGKMEWGDGTAAKDTNLYRSAASVLKTDGKLAVGSLQVTTTPASGFVLTSDSSGNAAWQAPAGSVSSQKFSQAIGNGAATSFTITHNLGSRDVVVVVRETDTPYGIVDVYVVATDINTVTVGPFLAAPTASQYTVNIFSGISAASLYSGKFVATIGNGSATTIAVAHGLNTSDVVVSVRRAASPFTVVLPGIEVTSSTTVTLYFDTAPTTGQYIVTVLAGSAGLATNTTPVVSVSANYSASINPEAILVNASGGSRTITLPLAGGKSGYTYVIKKTDTSTNTVIIDPTGSETIDGALTMTISTQNQSISAISDGTAWYAI